MSKRTILVSAGHDDRKKGAVGKGHLEADLTLALREAVIAELVPVKGFTVIRDGEAGENLALWRAAALARTADLAVEIHFNPNANAKGAECFGTEDTKSFCQRLAQACAKHMGRGLRGGRGGYKHHSESQHKSLAFVRAGGVVLEVCWMNRRGVEIYEQKRDLIASDIARVIRNEATALLREDDGGVLEAGASAKGIAASRGRHIVSPGSASGRARSLAAPHRRNRG